MSMVSRLRKTLKLLELLHKPLSITSSKDSINFGICSKSQTMTSSEPLKKDTLKPFKKSLPECSIKETFTLVSTKVGIVDSVNLSGPTLKQDQTKSALTVEDQFKKQKKKPISSKPVNTSIH